MLKVSKHSDYGIVLLSQMASVPSGVLHTARDLAETARLPFPMVSKILKLLARRGLLVSHRGVKGGYSLNRKPSDISVAEIITAIDGPIALTDCSAVGENVCEQGSHCPVQTNWSRINRVVQTALEQLPLSAMKQPAKQPAQLAHPSSKTAAPVLVPAGLKESV